MRYCFKWLFCSATSFVAIMKIFFCISLYLSVDVHPVYSGRKDCVCVCGIFNLLCFSCLSVLLTLIRVEMIGSLCIKALTGFRTTGCYHPGKQSRVTLFISFSIGLYNHSLRCVLLIFNRSALLGRKKIGIYLSSSQSKLCTQGEILLQRHCGSCSNKDVVISYVES